VIDYDIIVSGGKNVWTDGDPAKQPHLMTVLAANIRNSKHPKLADKKESWAQRIEVKAAAQAEAARPAEVSHAQVTTLAMQLSSNNAGGKQITISIGAFVALTGSSGDLNFQYAGQLATQDMNAALAAGPAGKHINFDVEMRDDASSTPTALGLVPAFVGLGVKALVSDSMSGIATAVNAMNYDVTQPLGLPITCAACTSGSINDPNATNSDPSLQAGYQDLDNWLRRTTISNVGVSDIQLRDLMSRGPNHDGDANGNGVVNIGVIQSNDTLGLATLATFPTAIPLVRQWQGLTTAPAVTTYPVLYDPTLDPNSYNYAADLAKVMAQAPLDALWDGGQPAQMEGYAVAYHNGGYTIPMTNMGSFLRDATLQALGGNGEGQEAVNNVIVANNASGAVFASEFEASSGSKPAGYDSSVYDAYIVTMLAILKAALPLADPSTVAPADVRTALDQLNVPTGEVIRTGTAEFTKAIAAIAAGHDINYEGASGPVDFDSVGNVRGDLATYRIVNGQFSLVEEYDCINHTADWNCPVVQQ